MDIQKFIKERPYLYHLTSQVNAENIITERKLYSANQLISMSENNIDNVKRQKRHQHYEIAINGKKYLLRDQRPISEKALSKCLTDSWNVGDFLYHLNDRVFMWPTLERLWKHYNRYENENPVIFRFSTYDIITANPCVKFCRLNSGATRANSYLGGKAPARGSDTFQFADNFLFSVRDVAEVTFENFCTIAGQITTGDRPDNFFRSV